MAVLVRTGIAFSGAYLPLGNQNKHGCFSLFALESNWLQIHTRLKQISLCWNQRILSEASFCRHWLARTACQSQFSDPLRNMVSQTDAATIGESWSTMWSTLYVPCTVVTHHNECSLSLLTFKLLLVCSVFRVVSKGYQFSRFHYLSEVSWLVQDLATDRMNGRRKLL